MKVSLQSLKKCSEYINVDKSLSNFKGLWTSKYGDTITTYRLNFLFSIKFFEWEKPCNTGFA